MRITGIDPQERLPEDRQRCLILLRNSEVEAATREGTHWLGEDRRIISTYEIELWAPMPELELPDLDNT